MKKGFFIEKPKTVFAVQWDGFDETLEVIRKEIGRAAFNARDGYLLVSTHQLAARAQISDWIVKYPDGKIYIVDDEEFIENYEEKEG